MGIASGLHMKIHNRSILIFFTAVLAGCASAPRPAPAPATKAAPASVSATKPAPAPAAVKPVPKPAAPLRPSLAAARSIDFDGSHFTAKVHTQDKGQVLTGFYLPGETPEGWTRFVDLGVYPTATNELTPAGFATLVGQRVVATNPSAHYSIYQNKTEDSVILDFITWTDADLKANILEVNLFKFYPDPKTGNLLAFHYAERVKMDARASTVDNGKKITAVRQRVLNEIAAVPLYRE